MCCVLMSSWARASAVSHCTIDEYKAMLQDGNRYMIKVHEHKTSSTNSKADNLNCCSWAARGILQFC